MPEHRGMLGWWGRNGDGDHNDHGGHVHEGVQILCSQDFKGAPCLGPGGASQSGRGGFRMGPRLRRLYLG